ncbi:CRAL/TRIO domain-containing protein [Cristinia sonorae]|uniref:CRAL/TRIO domain-containing protein n=1 Tax=Cristinia sonorae TaxID=1940300 RepID=A0A8K0UVK7_9AGAR|nr:CRAL/TRIO domain-containing protein [Cristinia sonorae]
MPPALSTEQQEAVLREFREQLVQEDLIHDGDSIGTDDRTLTRFLRARHYNLKQAKAMWKACQHWRGTVEGVGIDELYRNIDPWDYPERDHVFNCWPLWFHKKGRPLNIHFFGKINMPKLYKHISPERHWQTVLVNCESLTREVLPAATHAAGRPIDGTFVIVDLKGFSLSQFWQMKNLARSSFQVSQDYFPETMAQLAIVNAPSSFTTIWSFIKPWLAKETVAKVDILGSDYQSVLLDLIEAENLPSSLGGTCNCEGGCEKSNAGPWREGRQERREAWLRGEGEVAVQVNKDVLAAGARGTAEEDAEERKDKDSHEQALEEKASRGGLGGILSSVARKADSPGPPTPPLDAASEISGLALSPTNSEAGEGVRPDAMVAATKESEVRAVRESAPVA